MSSSATHTAKFLSSEDFGDLFKSFSRSAFRLETLPRYEVEEEAEEFAAYLEGNPLPPESSDDIDWRHWIETSTRQGRSWSRVHIMPEQLTPYLRYQIEWGYLFNSQAGEDIRLLFSHAASIPSNLPCRDFWLFDDSKVVIMHYAETGKYLGAEINQNNNELALYQQTKNFALQHSIALRNYLKELRNSPGKI
ncbi:MAG: DUF6879 family protein [Candidatus Dormibacteraceae bacterium]